MDDMKDQIEKQNEDTDEMTDEENDEMTDEDDEDKQKQELSDDEMEDLIDAIKKQEKFLDGEVEKGTANADDSKTLENLDESGSEIDETSTGYGSEKTKVFIINKIHAGMGSVAGLSDAQERDITDGLQMGKSLANKLKVRNDNHSMTSRRKKRGNIDRRYLSDLTLLNSKKIFKSSSNHQKKENIYLHISIDGSGSMNGERINKAINMAASVCVASDKVGGIHVEVSVRSDSIDWKKYYEVGFDRKNNYPKLVILYDSEKDNINKIKSIFPLVIADSSTPEGLCFEAITKRIKQRAKGRKTYFLNLSDGLPQFASYDTMYSGDLARIHTKEKVAQMESNGINVISYLIDKDGSQSQFKDMYGQSAKFIDCTNVMEIARSINKEFLRV